ncbi:MAG TPA: tRNA 2-thiocytidine(32) synthetase TtcA [Bdellovibrionales bacterium]|nr:tRNA 2-thiocytidine(32) synthetase TtcA [Bdellovibrionales bacterium]
METCAAPQPKLPENLNDKAFVDALEKRIFRGVGQAIGDFNLVSEGDRILVGVSGGKDSWTLLHVMNEMRKRAPVEYHLVAVNIDQGYPGFRQDLIADYLDIHQIPYHLESTTHAQIVDEKSNGAVPCSLCSRLRRGSLYGLAEKLGCNKIALGHHLDDFIETSLLNSFFIGRTGSMAVKLKAEDGKNTVIRPLVYVSEKDIVAYTKAKNFPVVCCACPLACGTNEFTDHKRRMVKNLINDLETKIPQIRNSLIASLGNIHPSHMLDTKLWNFEG